MDESSPKFLSASDPNLNITKRANYKRVRLEDEAESDKFDQFKEEIMELLSTMINPLNSKLKSVEKSLCDILKQNTEIKSSNSEIEKSLDFLSSQIKEFDSKIKYLEKENNSTKSLIAELEEKHGLLDRSTRKSEAYPSERRRIEMIS